MKTATRRRALTVEMTSGSLWKNILLFSLPLMMTQVLEVLFNLSDVAIAGKYAYNTYVALGSVGSTTTLVTLFTGLLIGLGGGVNVAVARGLGMGNDEDVEHTTHSSFLICLAMGVLTCLVCVFFAEPMLRLLHTKEEFLPGAVLYLKLYALGLPAMGIYNCGNGILSATGDTKRPLLYLTVAGVLLLICALAALPSAIYWLPEALTEGGSYWTWLVEDSMPMLMSLTGGIGCLFGGWHIRTSRRMRRKIDKIVGDAKYMYIQDIADAASIWKTALTRGCSSPMPIWTCAANVWWSASARPSRRLPPPRSPKSSLKSRPICQSGTSTRRYWTSCAGSMMPSPMRR